eukprot:365169-Chlamydomonas_euryale.AAC.14
MVTQSWPLSQLVGRPHEAFALWLAVLRPVVLALALHSCLVLALAAEHNVPRKGVQLMGIGHASHGGCAATRKSENAKADYFLSASVDSDASAVLLRSAN